MSPRLYCVLVTYKRPAGMAAALRFLERQARPPDLVVVVDNEGGNPDVRMAAKRALLDVVVLPASENLGPAGGTALAMSHILERADDQDWITRIDDDRDEDLDIFEELLRFAVEQRTIDRRVGAVGATGARYDWNRGRLLRVDDGEIQTDPIDVDYVPTNVFPAFSVAAVRNVGVFDADLFYGSSEVEYGLRLRQAGYRVVADPALWKLLGRRSAASAGARTGLRPFTWRRYYSLRNQIYILRKYGHDRTALRVAIVRGIAKPLLNLLRTPRLAATYLRWNTNAIVDGWRGHMGRTYEPEALSGGLSASKQ